MSRSRDSQCPNGRGCGVCGDAGEIRRAREADALAADRAAGDDPLAPAELRLIDADAREADGEVVWGPSPLTGLTASLRELDLARRLFQL